MPSSKSTPNPSIQVLYFRILSDQDEEFFRDIEILSDQTFLDFHEMIQRSIDFDGNELASFYQCDRDWNKEFEITLIDMEEDELPIIMMKRAKIKDFLADRHQRFLYEYDFLNTITLFIELMQTKKPESGKKYPNCVNCSGGLNMTLGIDDPLEDPVFKALDDIMDKDVADTDDEDDEEDYGDEDDS